MKLNPVAGLGGMNLPAGYPPPNPLLNVAEDFRGGAAGSLEPLAVHAIPTGDTAFLIIINKIMNISKY